MRRPLGITVMALLCLLTVGMGGNDVFAAKKEKLPTLKFWFPGNTPRELDAVVAEINKRIKDEIGAEVQFNFVPWSDYHNKIRALVAAGDDYEAHFDGDWGAIPTMAPQGAFLPLEKLLPKYAPTIWKTVEQDKWEGSKYANHIICIPWRWPKSERRVVQLRYDLYQKYGLKDFDTLKGDVFTLDDFEKYLDAVAKNEPGMIGVAPTWQWMAPFAYLAGYGLLNEQYNIVYRLDDPKMKLIDLEQTDFYKQMIQRFRRWYLKGYFEKDVLAQKEDYKDLMITGKASSIVHIFDSYNELSMQIAPSHPDWKVKAFLLSTDKVGPLSPPMNNCLLFNKKGKNPEKALMFWEWVHKSQENYDLVLYGIEGKHWNKGANGTVAIPAPFTMADSPYYGWNGRWCAFWPEYERATASDLPGWKDMTIKATYINDKLPPHTGFFPDLSSIKSELAQRYSLKENMGRALELGVLDPNTEYDKYIAKQGAAGRDRILSELQRQIDAWLAAKKK